MPITSFVGLKGNHKFKKAKENNVDDELKYEDYKNVQFNRSCMTHEMNRDQNKYHNKIFKN